MADYYVDSFSILLANEPDTIEGADACPTCHDAVYGIRQENDLAGVDYGGTYIASVIMARKWILLPCEHVFHHHQLAEANWGIISPDGTRTDFVQ